MNFQSKISKTEAEQALSDHFADAVLNLPGSAHVVEKRDRSFAALLQNGLPTRRVESWHYTDLRRLLSSVPTEQGDVSEAVAPFVEGAKVLSILDGIAADDVDGLPAGVLVTRACDALMSGDLDSVYTDHEDDDAIGQLNSALASDGFKLDIEAGVESDVPIELQCVQSGGQLHSIFPVHIGANSKATIIERHITSGGKAALVSAVSHIKLEAKAHVRWIIVQAQGAEDMHLGQVYVELAEDAELELYIVNAGGKIVRQEIIAEVAGSGANLTLRGVNLLAGDTHTDVTLKLGHNVPNTTSTEIFRNVAFDRAKGVFQGQIKVAQIAQKTDAQMACNTLLMSDDAEFSAKPELEIFADDVICAHGATVADIDADHLFYLMARGVSEKSARALLVKGFVAETVEELEDEAIVAALERVISEWLEING